MGLSDTLMDTQEEIKGLRTPKAYDCIKEELDTIDQAITKALKILNDPTYVPDDQGIPF